MCAGGEGKRKNSSIIPIRVVYDKKTVIFISGKDACQGFGGAPLVVNENGIYMQIGIMSFGSDNCGGRKIPSVYTSIAHFASWIRENSPVD